MKNEAGKNDIRKIEVPGKTGRSLGKWKDKTEECKY